MRDFKTLKVWQKSHVLAVSLYRVTGNFPKEEIYGLASQVRRAAVSIPANIAEGCGKDSEAEFDRYLQIAGGSASELGYHLLLCHDIGLLRSQDCESFGEKVSEIKKMLTTLLKKIRSRSEPNG